MSQHGLGPVWCSSHLPQLPAAALVSFDLVAAWRSLAIHRMLIWPGTPREDEVEARGRVCRNVIPVRSICLYECLQEEALR